MADDVGKGTARLRMAWAVLTSAHEACDAPSIYFAPTRPKVRAKVIADIQDAWDCSWLDGAEMIRSIRRAPESDVVLPLRHELAEKVGDKLLHIVVHAYGGKRLRAGNRDHFYTRSDDADLVALVQLGLFEKGADVPSRMSEGEPYAYFHLTDLGKLVAAGEQPAYPHV
jgi:hypothetical protein